MRFVTGWLEIARLSLGYPDPELDDSLNCFELICKSKFFHWVLWRLSRGWGGDVLYYSLGFGVCKCDLVVVVGVGLLNIYVVVFLWFGF